MSTVILVLLCLAIAGRELYIASDKRLPKALAELRELRAQLAELTRRHEELRGEVSAAEEPAGIPIPPPPPPPAAPPEVVERLDIVGERVERLEKDVGDLAAELAGLDLDREAQHALARSLDAVEQDVAELHRELLDRLDRTEGVVTGTLLSEEGEAEHLLADAYERCAAEYGLRVRVRDRRSARAANGTYWGTVYYLSGRRPDALAEDVFSYVRGLHDTHDPSALGALLTELAHLNGGGIARFGAFTAVRTASGLVCGVLPDPDDSLVPSEPWELASRLRELPETLQHDLTWLRTQS